MFWLLVVMLYVALPFAELAIIIVLAVLNGQKKRKIALMAQELDALRRESARAGWTCASEYAPSYPNAPAQPALPNEPFQPDAAVVRQVTVNAQMKSDNIQVHLEPVNARPGAENIQVSPESANAQPGAENIQVSPEPAKARPGTETVPVHPAPSNAQPRSANTPVQQVTAHAHPSAARPTAWQGNAALVIGVIFVVLAGLIFATTAWRILPDIGKVFVVMTFSGIFFGASAIAERRLKIQGTSKAFYILGSVFLFVAVLAVGFFELLGPELTLMGRNCYQLLLLGTVMTEAALLAGLKKFQENVYTGFCMAGFTVAAALITASFHPGRLGFALGMACYGVLLVMISEIVRRNDQWNAPDVKSPSVRRLLQMLPLFSRINLWGISVLVLMVFGTGMVTAAAAVMMAGVHLYLAAYSAEKSAALCDPEAEIFNCRMSAAAFAVLLLAGLWRAVSPQTAAGGLYTIAAVLILLGALERTPAHAVLRSAFQMAGLAAAGLLTVGVALAVVLDDALTVHGLICMGLLTLDITLTALKYKSNMLKGIHSLYLAAFLNYGIFLTDMRFEGQLFLASLMFAALYLAGLRSKNPLSNLAGNILFTVLTAVDAILLFWWTMFRFGDGTSCVMAILSILAFTAVVSRWSRLIPHLRQTLVPVSFGLPLLTARLLSDWGGVNLGYEKMFMAYLLLYILWDILRQDHMQIGILAVGGLLGLGYFARGAGMSGADNMPFFLVLAAYLLVRNRKLEGRQRNLSDYGVCALIMAGMYVIFFTYLNLDVSIHLALTVVLAAEYVIWRFQKKGREMERFFQIAFSANYLFVICSFYGGLRMSGAWSAETLAFLPAVLAAFAAVYVLTCRTGDLNLHLLTAVLTLNMPRALGWAAGISNHQIYGVTALLLLAFGGGCRMKWNIIEWNAADGAAPNGAAPDGTKSGRPVFKADWFHILAGPAVFAMALLAPDRRWTFAYILLGVAWALQYAALPRFKRAAFTAAGCLAVLAFWVQPFITWPEPLELEICLIPAAVFIWWIGKMWKMTPQVFNFQTGLFSLCLLALALDAFRTGGLADALILEGICLTVFLYSCMGKCRRWAHISGGTALGVALYVTRGFWLSISWWVYLLAAGIGLILFAARNEMKKH